MGNPTGQGPIPVACERCGRRDDLQPPAPGDRDLGLDRIKAAFRYCAGCQLFVGRTCCWQPEALACTVDASRFALSTTTQLAQPLNQGATEGMARRRLEEMATSVDELERTDMPVADPPGSDHEREIERQAWVDAWGEIGSLVARVETSRDAAAKALWRPPTGPAASTAHGLNAELKALEDRYRRARAVAEERLRVAAGPLAGRRRRQMREPKRRPGSSLALGALAAVAVLSFSTASLLQVGLIDPFGAGRSAAASQPEEGLLGGGPGGLIASLDFDALPIGTMDASGDIVSVTGEVEVVDVPSPFDRGIRVRGQGSHRFCVPSAGSEGGSIRFDVDLYTRSALASGRIQLTVAPAGATATVVSVSLRALGSLQTGAWHRLHAAWEPRQAAVIDIGEATGELRRLTVPSAQDAEATPGTACVGVSGMGTDAELLIGSLRVQR